MDAEDLSPTTKRIWRLNKYARYMRNRTGSDESQSTSLIGSGEWDTVEDSQTARLTMSLSITGHLSIMSETTALENYFLIDARNWLKAFCKNDCIVISYKTKSESRIFRIQFAPSGIRTKRQTCEDCANTLKKYFPVNMIATQPEDDAEKQQVARDPPISDKPCVSDICSAILSNKELPLLYQHCNYDITNSEEDITKFVTTCLTDPNFPDFVKKIENALNAIKNK